jgi:general secretion pathway protein L
MVKKYIGVDIGLEVVRVVTLTLEKGVPVFTGVGERQALTVEERAQALNELLGELAFGDLVAASLSTVGSYCRRLEFPFSEARKIEPAMALEMNAQLPTTDDLVCDFLAPRPSGDIFAVSAAAVKRAAVLDILALFKEAGQPLHILDLSPFAYVAALADDISEGILAVVTGEITVAQIRDGQVVSFRTMPHRHEDSVENLAAVIQRYYRTLVKAGDNPAPLFLIGAGAGDELCQALRDKDLMPQYPPLEIDNQPMDPAMLPAAAVALRAALPGNVRRFNFLKGDLAPKNEWAGFRLRLIAIAALLGLTFIFAVTGAYLNYGHQQKRAALLKAKTIAIFRQTFPQIHTIVDVPSQMRTNLASLREKARLLGIGGNRSVLNMLREISARTPRSFNVDIREIVYEDGQLHLKGRTSSFEAINRLSQALAASPLFQQPQIADAKMGLAGGKVDFSMTIKTSAEDGQ